MTTKHQVKTGGKLYIVGEYAVLSAGQTALIKNIPIYMTATIEASEEIHISSDMFSYSVGMIPDSNYALIQETITVFASYLNDSENGKPFEDQTASNTWNFGVQVEAWW